MRTPLWIAVHSAANRELGDGTQKACKDEPDAALDMAKAKARGYKASHR